MGKLGKNLFDFTPKQRDEIFWQDYENEYSFGDIESMALAQSRYFAHLTPGTICALSGFAPLELWTLMLSAWSHGLTVLPFAEKASTSAIDLALNQLPWSLHLRREPRAAEDADANTNSITITNAAGFNAPTGNHPLNASDPSIDVLIMTSGSTGAPKAIAHSLDSLFISAQATLAFYGWQPRDSSLLSLDPSHIGGLQILIRVWHGRGLCFYGGEPKEVARALAYRACDYLSLVPTQIFRLLEDPVTAKPLRQAKAILLGGAATQESLLAQLRPLGLPVSITYGSSETASQISAWKPGVFPDRPEHVGTIFPIWQLESTPDRDLWIKGKALMRGYWQHRIWTPVGDGRYRLSDRGSLLAGELFLDGRRDQVFQVGGENVAPAEILQCLEKSTSYALGDMQVVTRDDAVFGVVPWVIVRSPRRPDSSSWNTAFDGLPPIKRPREIWWFQSDEVSKLSKAHLEHLLSVGDDHLKRLWKYEKI